MTDSSQTVFLGNNLIDRKLHFFSNSICFEYETKSYQYIKKTTIVKLSMIE